MIASKRFECDLEPGQNAGKAKLGESESNSAFAAGMATATDSPMEPELVCPACRIPLAEMRTATGVIWRCEKCDGRAVGLQLLRRTFTPESINLLWLHAIHNEGSIARPCPSCGNAMIEVALDSSSGIRIEVCRLCEFVWFDAGETQPLQVRPAPKPLPPPLPQEVREAIALATVQQLAAQTHRSDFDRAPPQEWWKSIAAFLGLPSG